MADKGQAYRRGYRESQRGEPFKQPFTGYLADQYAAGWRESEARKTEIARFKKRARERRLL